MVYINTFIVTVTLIGIVSCKPIMVSYGTKEGPIIPRDQSASLAPRNLVARSPAPVSEDREDVPNPNIYRPLVPHQYRTKLLSIQPPTNFIFGTPLDVKFTPSLQKYNLQKKQAQGRSLGTDYTGPHIFEKQDYEFLDNRQKTTLQPSIRYVKPHYYQQIQNTYNLQNNDRYVPQIGIIYSGGVRYYIPQIISYEQQQREIQQQKDENSVYDHANEKRNL